MNSQTEYNLHVSDVFPAILLRPAFDAIITWLPRPPYGGLRGACSHLTFELNRRTWSDVVYLIAGGESSLTVACDRRLQPRPLYRQAIYSQGPINKRSIYRTINLQDIKFTGHQIYRTANLQDAKFTGLLFYETASLQEN